MKWNACKQFYVRVEKPQKENGNESIVTILFFYHKMYSNIFVSINIGVNMIMFTVLHSQLERTTYLFILIIFTFLCAAPFYLWAMSMHRASHENCCYLQLKLKRNKPHPTSIKSKRNRYIKRRNYICCAIIKTDDALFFCWLVCHHHKIVLLIKINELTRRRERTERNGKAKKIAMSKENGKKKINNEL